MVLTGSQIVLECLKEQGVDTVFGYPGGTILNVYDELYKQQDNFLHILTSHEQGAAHAADGYARSTGKVGVCLATSGPGSTNLVTGIATAYMDSVPMVAITANVNLPLLGKDTFQEVDIAGITMPITKHGYIVKDIKVLADTIRKAFKIARTGRPGPVIVDITKDVTAASCEYRPVIITDEEPEKDFNEDDVKAALKLIKASKRPYIYVGGGAVISGASKELKEFAELIDAPVCDTLMGKGAFDAENKLYTGMIGMHGTKTSNFGVSECDLLITLGARFSDRVIGNAKTFAGKAKILQVDVDAAEINKNIRTNVSVIGDLKEVLKVFNSKLEQMDHSDWIKKIQDYKKKYPLSYETNKLTCPYIIEELYNLTKGDAIISTDVGQHQMWTAQYYKFNRPRTLLTSGGLGTMGYGLGACIGAQVGNPDKLCVNIAGDGCFRMNMNELATASRYNLPIIEIVINNHVLGMVRQWQTLFYNKHYSQTVFEDKVDYCKVAEGLGCEAIRITKKSEVVPALKKAIKSKKPVLIDCIIEEDDKVFPMVPAGASISEAFDASDLEAKKK
ncbi:MAG: biosynthetic-type acetolactate synthase large subunit [Butyrivibrio sp.]|uniref:biosynthetic-type acetolactate synthase large subunit n=1 Tax=Butyrivibrio sp. TaxID=28121 RepID=UPI001B5F325C|nr:biosynthetic-type acetolactate synthase large subunit [Butyrivibrio sp.]MBP3782294.1 biosynthetic-type acetolactate synthase large subunit [Butyrivibrio sp.]